ncbi:MAG: caspase family protein [Nitrospirota bacterium]|nr:caspase family protein [Nitrospirota bacterium]
MKTHNIRSNVLLLLILFAFLGQTLMAALVPAFGAVPNASVKRALLIGIGKYEVLPRLPGSKNDIDLVHQVLMSRYGFSDHNIHVVRDEAATRVGILSALNNIVQEAGPNDVVYIHYSGHGSQVEDLNGDEPDDKLDETIVPQDGRTEGVADITDDELEAILAQLKTSQAVVVLDSCHSGTATRGLEVRVRSVPTDDRVALYKKGGVLTRAIVPLNKHAYVLFSGAASHEEALDGPVDGRYHGFFTHSLFKSLQSAPTGASTREIFAGAKSELKRIQNQFGRTSMPEPQLEASKARIEQPFFALNSQAGATTPTESESARRSWVTVQAQKGADYLLVNAVALGADPGSVWAIYSDGETAFDPAKAESFAVVKSVQEGHAIAKVSGGSAAMTGQGRAIMIAPAPQSQRIPVRLLNVSSEQANDLKRALQQKLGEIEFVGDEQFARFLVDAKDNRWHVYSADGEKKILSLPISANPKALDPMAQVLVQSRNASQLLALENPASQINLDVSVVRVGERGIAVVSDRMDAPVYHIRRAREARSLSNSLQLEITTDTDCYITIVDVDAEGNVNVLFPNPYQNQRFYADGFVRAGRSILLPDSLNAGNRAGFHWDYANPPGVDTIRVFASTDRQLTTRIRESVGSSGQSDLNQGVLVGKPLARLVSLRNELIGGMTRGLITVSDEPMGQPAAYENPPAIENPSQGEAFPQQADMGGVQGGGSPGGYDPAVPYGSEAGDHYQAMPVQQPVADWTAASVTVLVQP